MLLLQIAPAHSESRRGRERGRSIPFASFRGRAAIWSLLVQSGHLIVGNAAGRVANDPKRSFRWHGAHAVAIASDPHTLRAVGDELQNETS
jgi:hypothetical protein